MEKNILHSIFFDEYNHWDKLVDNYGQRIREVVQSEVNKFRHCGEIVSSGVIHVKFIYFN